MIYLNIYFSMVSIFGMLVEPLGLTGDGICMFIHNLNHFLVFVFFCHDFTITVDGIPKAHEVQLNNCYSMQFVRLIFFLLFSFLFFKARFICVVLAVLKVAL